MAGRPPVPMQNPCVLSMRVPEEFAWRVRQEAAARKMSVREYIMALVSKDRTEAKSAERKS